MAEEFCEKGVEILAINGGDGTISQTISTFLRVYGERPLPMIAILRGGTMNMLADNLAIKGSPEQLLYQLVESYATGLYKTAELGTLKIGDSVGFLFASGSALRFLEAYYGNKSNKLGAVLLIGKLILGCLTQDPFYFKLMKSEKLILKPDQKESLQLDSSFLFCGSVEKLPLGISFFPKMRNVRDKFQSTAITAEAKKIPLLLFPFLLGTEAMRQRWKRDLFCESLEIEAESSRAMAYTLDGEIYYPKENKIKIEKGPTLRFVLT